MIAAALSDSAPVVAPTSHGLRSKTLSATRWMAIVGQLATVFFTEYALGFDLPLMWCLLVILAAVWFNVLAAAAMPKNARLSERAATIWLVFDATQLAALIGLTGGLNNPFVLLFLAPLTVAAAVLSTRSVWIVGALSIAYLCVLEVIHLPLLRDNGDVFIADSMLYRLGMWSSLVFAVAFFAFYVRRVAAETQSMSEALTATKLALAREQKLSSLGALLAATAHQLGTPLSTIAVVAKEMETELGDSPVLQEDVRLIRQQTERCRAILAELNTSRHSMDEESRAAPMAALVEEAAAPFYDRGKAIQIIVEADPASDSDTDLDTDLASDLASVSGVASNATLEAACDAQGDPAGPIVRRKRPEIVHGLRNLIQNAVDFADATAYAVIRVKGPRVSVTVADDGPGYPADVMARLGEPFTSTRARAAAAALMGETYQGMGLGVFIAKTLLERSGARVVFSNGPLEVTPGVEVAGAVARAVWRIDDLQDET